MQISRNAVCAPLMQATSTVAAAWLLATGLTGPVQAATLKTLVNFTGTNGQNPSGSLIIDAEGLLYGTTREGGGGLSRGTVFNLGDAGFVVSPPVVTDVPEPATWAMLIAGFGLVGAAARRRRAERAICRGESLAKLGGSAGFGFCL